MAQPQFEAGQGLILNTTGFQAVTSGNAAILGILFAGSGTGSVQFFAGVTGSSSITPLITFSATASALQNSLSPFFCRIPMVVSGSGTATGFSVKVGAAADPQFQLYWVPMGGP